MQKIFYLIIFFFVSSPVSAACYLKDGTGPVWQPPLTKASAADFEKYAEWLSSITVEEWNEAIDTGEIYNHFSEGTSIAGGRVSAGGFCFNARDPKPCWCRPPTN
tara:strand:- start:931 stop:1245 length:315 start_codon:yes stop_codon:yes gene_type:complete